MIEDNRRLDKEAFLTYLEYLALIPEGRYKTIGDALRIIKEKCETYDWDYEETLKGLSDELSL